MADIKLSILYVNHGLRPEEAKREISFLRKTGLSLGIPLYVETVDARAARKKVGLEAAARKLRYARFVKVAGKLGCSRIATGHNLNDQAETILLNILRSTGQEGMTGMPLSRELGEGLLLIRPLSKILRKDILAYLKARKISYCTDSSNFSLSLSRNRIRHKVMPLLEELNPGIYSHLDAIGEWNGHREHYFDSLAEKLAGNGFKAGIKGKKACFTIDLKEFLRYNKYLQYKIIRNILFKGSCRNSVYSSHVLGILDFAGDASRDVMSYPLQIVKRRGKLSLYL